MRDTKHLLSSYSLLTVIMVAADAEARSDGIPADCTGCHGSGATVQLQVTPADFEPGETVDVLVSIQGQGAIMGLYLTSTSGRFEIENGSVLQQISDTELTHRSPVDAGRSNETFRASWSAPTMPGRVEFRAYGLRANNNGRQSGDQAGRSNASFFFGCSPTTFFGDIDGDGHGSQRSGTVIDCRPPPGYVESNDDCDDRNASISPSAEEVCNTIDDNCNGRVDEGVIPTCGIGWCRRLASGCGADAFCEPGEPSTERCNGLDDDCDGTVDEGALCENGDSCREAECQPVSGESTEGPELASGHMGQSGSEAAPPNLPGSSDTDRQADSSESGCRAMPGISRQSDLWVLIALTFVRMSAVRQRRRRTYRHLL